MKAVLPALARPLLEPHLPSGLDVAWFTTFDEAQAGIVDAEIAWVDMQPTALVADAIRASGPALKWVSMPFSVRNEWNGDCVGPSARRPIAWLCTASAMVPKLSAKQSPL